MKAGIISFLSVIFAPIVAFSANEGVPSYYQTFSAPNANQIGYNQYANPGLGGIYDIVTDSNGRIIISDTGNNRVIVLDKDFKTVKQIIADIKQYIASYVINCTILIVGQ